ncbi:hypothetical protein K0M31_013562 [Melipona bicolor]|uniref:Uncharacterized protein n=1 Tax=Melipona bicolor TaxID=60889 RepID=A0AA40KG36_9HYME|nr:hypothetical protein K0M31_013562 [Melipona bicolor]
MPEMNSPSGRDFSSVCYMETDGFFSFVKPLEILKNSLSNAAAAVRKPVEILSYEDVAFRLAVVFGFRGFVEKLAWTRRELQVNTIRVPKLSTQLGRKKSSPSKNELPVSTPSQTASKLTPLKIKLGK